LLTKKPNYTVDVRGTISPFSLLKVSLVYQQMQPSEMMEILGCDAEMRQDLRRLLPDAAWEPAPTTLISQDQEMTTLRLKKAEKPASR
jgi:TusA-related sulfurtransferase